MTPSGIENRARANASGSFPSSLRQSSRLGMRCTSDAAVALGQAANVANSSCNGPIATKLWLLRSRMLDGQFCFMRFSMRLRLAPAALLGSAVLLSACVYYPDGPNGPGYGPPPPRGAYGPPPPPSESGPPPSEEQGPPP